MIADQIVVGKMGYYLPWAAASGVIAAIGTGLLSLLTPQTPTGKWLGYQLIAGIGRGLDVTMESLLLLFLNCAHSNMSYFYSP